MDRPQSYGRACASLLVHSEGRKIVVAHTPKIELTVSGVDMRLVAFLIHLLVLLASASPSLAQSGQGKWEVLGAIGLDGSDNAKTIRLDENAKKTTALRIVSESARVEISQIEIRYASGRVDYLDEPLTLEPSTPSREIAERRQSQVVETIIVQLLATKGGRNGRLVVSGLVVSEVEPLRSATRESGTRGPAGKSRSGQEVTERGAASGQGSGETPKFIPVDVYYATTRQRGSDRPKSGIKLASFTGQPSETTTLGKAIVTVPTDRKPGTIPRPYFGFRWVLGKEDPTKEFTLARVDLLDANGFYDRVGRHARDASKYKRQAFVFIHGYWVQFDDALYHAAQLATDIGFDGPPIVFSWPSRGNAWSYVADRDAAKASRNALREFLANLAKNSDVEAVNVIAHSMGNEPLIDILNEQAVVKERGGRPLDFKLREVVFAAPDVSRQAFAILNGRLRSLVAGGGTLYASANDIALGISTIAVNLQDRAGYVPKSSTPLIIKDVETIDMTQASWIFSLNHSTFSERRHIIDDLELLFSGGKRPPHERYKVFRPVDVAGGQRYWRYEQ